MTKSTKPTQAEPETDTQNEAAQAILDFGSAMTATPHGNIYCLTIIGQIEGHMTASSGTKPPSTSTSSPSLPSWRSPARWRGSCSC